MKIKMTPPAQLEPYAGNARTHSDEQIAQIAASIEEFGFTNPILADGEGVIIAGHGRLSAAQRLGLEKVPVITLDYLTDAQRRALVIADNKLAENAGWDEETLRLEIEALQELEFDLDLIGFSDEELDALLDGIDGGADAEADGEDDVPETPEDPVSQPGDLWILGNHRLLCGNSTLAGDVERLIGSEKLFLMATDPAMGSGSMLGAAETTGRVCLGIELNPAYVDVAVVRWQQLTGQTAMLDGDGRSFDEIANSGR